jgi:ribosomal protein S18 acetylase RimI-like enzyme
MPLPILQVRHEPTEADLVRLFHRTEAMWIGNLSEAEALEVGTAYCNPDLSSVWDANNVRDAALHAGLTPAAAVAEVEAHYARRGSRCAYWVTNPSADAGQTRPLVEHLLSNGYRAQVDDILYLRRKPVAVAEVGGLKVIPARASYRHAEALARERVAERWGVNEQLVDAQIRDLENPSCDALLALVGDRAVATLAVLAVGELGRIENVYVSQDFRGRGIGRTMMSRALEICARSLFKHVFILVDPGNAAAQGLYRGMGFEKLAEMVSYRAAGS